METSQKLELPVILAVDDEPTVLSAVARDLRHEYGEHYKVMRADSGVAALDLVQQLKLRNTPVALFLVDQRMPLMSGVEFLAEAIELFPDAKRVLLTAYADTEAAISAIRPPVRTIRASLCSSLSAKASDANLVDAIPIPRSANEK